MELAAVPVDGARIWLAFLFLEGLLVWLFPGMRKLAGLSGDIEEKIAHKPGENMEWHAKGY